MGRPPLRTEVGHSSASAPPRFLVCSLGITKSDKSERNDDWTMAGAFPKIPTCAVLHTKRRRVGGVEDSGRNRSRCPVIRRSKDITQSMRLPSFGDSAATRSDECLRTNPEWLSGVRARAGLREAIELCGYRKVLCCVCIGVCVSENYCRRLRVALGAVVAAFRSCKIRTSRLRRSYADCLLATFFDVAPDGS